MTCGIWCSLVYSHACCECYTLFSPLHFVNPGDLWSGSEGGGIKIWPWEAVEKSIHLTKEERHSAVIFVERSYVDLRSQLSTNGFSNMLTSDVKYLVSDNLRAKVWSAGYFSFALWWDFPFKTLMVLALNISMGWFFYI